MLVPKDFINKLDTYIQKEGLNEDQKITNFSKLNHIPRNTVNKVSKILETLTNLSSGTKDQIWTLLSIDERRRIEEIHNAKNILAGYEKGKTVDSLVKEVLLQDPKMSKWVTRLSDFYLSMGDKDKLSSNENKKLEAIIKDIKEEIIRIAEKEISVFEEKIIYDTKNENDLSICLRNEVIRLYAKKLNFYYEGEETEKVIKNLSREVTKIKNLKVTNLKSIPSSYKKILKNANDYYKLCKGESSSDAKEVIDFYLKYIEDYLSDITDFHNKNRTILGDKDKDGNIHEDIKLYNDEKKRLNEELLFEYVKRYEFVDTNLVKEIINYDQSLRENLFAIFKNEIKKDGWDKYVETIFNKKIGILSKYGLKDGYISELKDISDKQMGLKMLYRMIYSIRVAKDKKNQVQQIESELHNFEKSSDVSYLMMIKKLSKSLREKNINKGYLSGLLSEMNKRGNLIICDEGVFENKYRPYTDSFCVETDKKIYINRGDPIYKQTMDLIEKGDGNIPRNKYPYLDKFCDVLMHELQHVFQDMGDHEFLSRQRKILDSDSNVLLNNTREYFNSINKTAPDKDDIWKDEDIIKELDAEYPIIEKKFKEDSNWQPQTKWEELAKEFYDQCNNTNNKELFEDAPIRGGLRGSELGIGGMSIGKNNKEKQKVTEYLDPSIPLATARNILENFDKLHEAAKILDDKDFLEGQDQYKDNIETVLSKLEELNTMSDKDKRNDANQEYIYATKKYLDKIFGLIDEAKEEIAGYNAYSAPGFFRKLYDNTTLIPPIDIVKAFEITLEWGKRRYQRAQDARVGQIGESFFKKLPFTETLAQDFGNQVQSAESTEVNQLQEIMKNETISAVIAKLHDPSGNVDMMKAAFQELSERGVLEPHWNEPIVWKWLSKFSHASVYNQATAMQACDLIWGTNTGRDWQTKDTNQAKSLAKEKSGDAETKDPEPDYKMWISQLKRWQRGGKQDWDLRPDYTDIMGAIMADLEGATLSGSVTIPYIQEIILLEGVPRRLMDYTLASYMTRAPVYSLNDKQSMIDLGIIEATGWNIENAGNVNSKLYKFMRGELALPLRFNPEILQRTTGDEKYLVTVHDFQAVRTRQNNSIHESAKFDQEHADYLWPGLRRKTLTELLTPTGSSSQDMIDRDESLTSGLWGIIKSIKSYAEADNKYPNLSHKDFNVRRKAKLKELIRDLFTIMEYCQRSGNPADKNKKRYEFTLPESEIKANPGSTDYTSHFTKTPVGSVDRRFGRRSESRWTKDMLRNGKKDIIAWAEQIDVVCKKKGGYFGLADIMSTYDATSPFNHYEKVMRAIDRMQ